MKTKLGTPNHLLPELSYLDMVRAASAFDDTACLSTVNDTQVDLPLADATRRVAMVSVVAFRAKDYSLRGFLRDCLRVACEASHDMQAETRRAYDFADARIPSALRRSAPLSRDLPRGTMVANLAWYALGTVVR